MTERSHILNSLDFDQNQQIAKIENGGLLDRERCHKIAKYGKLFDFYDERQTGSLETITAGKMLMDVYRAMNKQFLPTATDIASYARIFDKQQKGKITFEDVERFAMKYYCCEY